MRIVIIQEHLITLVALLDETKYKNGENRAGSFKSKIVAARLIIIRAALLKYKRVYKASSLYIPASKESSASSCNRSLTWKR